MVNLALINKRELSKRHYVVKTKPELDYFFNFFPKVLHKKERASNGGLYLVIAGDPSKANDFYSIPFRKVAHIFDERYLVSAHNMVRWYGSIRDHILAVRTGASKLDVSEFYGNRTLFRTLSASLAFDTEEVLSPEKFWEGALRRITVNAFERDDVARRACISHFGATCRACDFDFGAKYGRFGTGFIHVHHIRPLSDIRAGYVVDPKRDLIPVCPNCHAMLHQTSPPLSVKELRRRIQNVACNRLH